MIFMKSHIENISAASIIYMRRTGAYGPENYQLMQKMKDWIQEHGLWNEGGTIYAIAWDNSSVTDPKACRYDVCFATNSDGKDSAIQRGTLPAGAYLVFEIPHTAEDMQRFWTSIADLLTKEDVQMDCSRPIMERYQFALVEKGCCEFCIPVID